MTWNDCIINAMKSNQPNDEVMLLLRSIEEIYKVQSGYGELLLSAISLCRDITIIKAIIDEVPTSIRCEYYSDGIHTPFCCALLFGRSLDILEYLFDLWPEACLQLLQDNAEQCRYPLFLALATLGKCHPISDDLFRKMVITSRPILSNLSRNNWLSIYMNLSMRRLHILIDEYEVHLNTGNSNPLYNFLHVLFSRSDVEANIIHRITQLNPSLMDRRHALLSYYIEDSPCLSRDIATLFTRNLSLELAIDLLDALLRIIRRLTLDQLVVHKMCVILGEIPPATFLEHFIDNPKTILAEYYRIINRKYNLTCIDKPYVRLLVRLVHNRALPGSANPFDTSAKALTWESRRLLLLAIERLRQQPELISHIQVMNFISPTSTSTSIMPSRSASFGELSSASSPTPPAPVYVDMISRLCELYEDGSYPGIRNDILRIIVNMM